MKSKDSNSKKSVSYQKKDGRSHTRPSFFWYDNDKDLKVCFLVTHVIYQNNISSFFSLQVAESDQATFTDLVRELTQNCVSDLEKAR